MNRVCKQSLLWTLCLMPALGLSGCATFLGKGAAADADRRTPREDKTPRAGDIAPTFALKMLDDDSKRVKLASFREQKPVVLFFGSYT